MIVLNFSHPLTPAQVAQLETLTQQRLERVLDLMVQARFDHSEPFTEQARALVDGIGLTAGEWQLLPLLVVPPALNFSAVVVLAELHGRMGYFPTIVRLRPVQGAAVTEFEIAEVINLQTLRDAARARR